MEKRIALSGAYSATAHIYADSRGIRLRLLSRRPLPRPCTACLCFAQGGKLRCFPVEDGEGFLPFSPDTGPAPASLPDALLLAGRGGTLLASGGFAGRREALEKARLQMRMELARQEAQAQRGAASHRGEAPPSPGQDARGSVAEGEGRRGEGALEEGRSPTPAVARGAQAFAKTPAPGQSRNGVGARRPGAPRAAAQAASRNGSTAGGPASPALLRILEQAQTLFGPLQQQQAAAAPPTAPAEAPFIPFPQAYPGLEWKKVPYPGTSRCYLEAHLHNREGRFLLHAIAGDYAPVPPVPDFKRFLRGADGNGYWLRVRRDYASGPSQG